MSHEHSSAQLAVRLAEHHLNSARPNAPVVADRRPRRRPVTRLRAAAAADLHRVARWLEPTDRRPVPAGNPPC